MAHSRRFLANQKARNAVVGAENLLKTIIGWGFCDIQNNQGRGKGPLIIEVLHGSHVAWQEQWKYFAYERTSFPMGKESFVPAMQHGCRAKPLFWISQKPNLIIALLYIERKKRTRVFASSLTASNTKRANLTWLPVTLTWLPVTLTWLSYNREIWRHRCWFRKFIVRFRSIKKEIVSSMYKYSPYPRRLQCLTICRYHYKGSTFSSVNLRPWVLVRSGARTLDLPHSRLALYQLSWPGGN